MQDLWNSRRCLDKIEGFDHSIVNATLGACGELPAPQEGPCLPYFVWQSGKYKVPIYFALKVHCEEEIKFDFILNRVVILMLLFNNHFRY